MPLVMYSDVILTRDVTEHGLRAGDVGTVVECHAVLGVSEDSVEFFDMTGNTVPSSFCRRVLSVCRHRPIVQPFAPCQLKDRNPGVRDF
jgi:hypothetical protein